MKEKQCIAAGIAVSLILAGISGCGLKEEENSHLSQTGHTAEIGQAEELKNENEDLKNDSEPQAETVTADYKEVFGDVKGCAVIFDSEKNRYTIYNEDTCRTRVSPDSTFKVISTLIGLHNQAVMSKDSRMGYEGVDYPVDAWNADLSLAEAFQNSCIWYYRKVIDAVGQETVQMELDQLAYGNCDISGWEGSGINPYPELNGFWLESSLMISPLEQVDVLRNIMEGKTIYTDSEVEILKDIMMFKNDSSQKIYGKTGTGIDGTAWFIGFMEKVTGNIYFAVYLNDDSLDAIDGNRARDLALKVLGQFY